MYQIKSPVGESLGKQEHATWRGKVEVESGNQEKKGESGFK